MWLDDMAQDQSGRKELERAENMATIYRKSDLQVWKQIAIVASRTELVLLFGRSPNQTDVAQQLKTIHPDEDLHEESKFHLDIAIGYLHSLLTDFKLRPTTKRPIGKEDSSLREGRNKNLGVPSVFIETLPGHETAIEFNDCGEPNEVISM